MQTGFHDFASTMTPEGKGVTLQCWRLLEQGGGDVRGIAGGIVKNEVENFGLPWEDVQCRKKWRRRSKGQLDYPGLCARMAIETMYLHVCMCACVHACVLCQQQSKHFYCVTLCVSAVYAVTRCPSICPCHVGALYPESRRLKISSNFFLVPVSPSF